MDELKTTEPASGDIRFGQGVACGVIFCMLLGFVGIWFATREPGIIPGTDFPIEWAYPSDEDKRFYDNLAAVGRKRKIESMRAKFRKFRHQDGIDYSDAEIDAIIEDTTPDIKSRLDPFTY